MLVKETTRNLARIEKILALEPILKADRLELAVLEGWNCVVEKGIYKPGDEALYFEIDAAVPVDSPVLASTNRKYLRIITDEASNKEYALIKTMRLRGVLSQGLLLSLKNYEDHIPVADRVVGKDLQSLLGVLKYVSPAEARLYAVEEIVIDPKASATRKFFWALRAKLMKGIVVDGLRPFPEGFVKSDEGRVQNSNNKYRDIRACGHSVELSVKLNGESALFYSHTDSDEIGVAQRNFSLSQEDVPYTFQEQCRVYASDWIRFAVRRLAGGRSSFPQWKKGFLAQSVPLVAWFFRRDVDYRLQRLNLQLASDAPPFTFAAGMKISIQGEMIGPDFNGNEENVRGNEFYAYRVYGNGSIRFTPAQARAVVEHLGFNYVPVVDPAYKLPENVADVLKLADAPGHFDSKRWREGLVAKDNITGTSFKIISNKWLEKEK